MNRVKLLMIIISLVITVSILMIENNFYKKPEIAKWRTLTWDDFKGIPTPFSNWAAVISSDVYIEYDTDTEKFYAYAGQNNLESWKKQETEGSNYTLEHEQYHFNLTEVYARKLNEYVDENPNNNESQIRTQRNRLRNELIIEQDNYDTQTDHGLDELTQHSWEYKIDSMLNGSDKEEPRWIDLFSGASFVTRETPVVSSGIIDSTTIYQVFEFNKYGLNIQITTFQNTQFDFGQKSIEFLVNYANSNYKVEYLKKIEGSYDLRYRVLARDTLNNHVKYEDWIASYPFINVMSITSYYDSLKNHSVYDTLSLDLSNSFSLHTRDSLIINLYESSGKSVETGITTEYNSSDDMECLVFATDSPEGVYGLPVKIGKDTLLVPYRVLNVADSLIQEKIFVYEGKTYSDTSIGQYATFPIPLSDVSNDIVPVYLGYILKEDSLNECSRVFGQNVVLITDSPDK